MVPDPPSVNRRGLLAGAGVALVGATLGVGAVEPTALPDPVTDQATKWLPEPPKNRWRPPVSEAHASDAVERLADEVERGRDLWDDIDADRRFHGDGGHLDDARADLDAGNYRDALFAATTGMQFAAEDVGFALARLDRPEADPERLAERGAATRERAAAVVDGIDEYRVVDPGRDLGWHYEIERWIRLSRWAAHEHDPDREYDARDIGSIRAGNLQADQRVRDAEHYREQLRTRVGDDGDPWADRIDRLDRRFREAIEGFPARETLFEEVESLPEGRPYSVARWQLMMWCYDTDYLFDNGTEDLALFRAVQAAQALANRRAHDRAVDSLVVDREDRTVDSGHVIREKRAAMRVYRRVVGTSPAPLLDVLTARAAEDIDVAEVRLGDRDGPAWRDRVDAYCYALIARMKLTEYGPIYGRFVG